MTDLKEALRCAYEVVKANVDIYTDHFQHVSEEGIFPREENKLWTMSFYPGQLYLLQKTMNDEGLLRHRDAILDSFRKRCDSGHMETHDIGFLYELTAYYDYLYSGDASSRQLVIDAADKLMIRYNEAGRFIQAWGSITDEEGEVRIIIDCMMNLPILHIASELTGDPKYREAAINHAEVSSRTLLREDSTTFHTYWMDNLSGAPLRGATHQGHKDESTWARGQAWSVYGFQKNYALTKDERFLEAAIKSADRFLENLPKDEICYWDFDFTDDNPDIRDSSAASIAAAGLLKLAKDVPGAQGKHYHDEAVRILGILADKYQNTEAAEGKGLLKEGMYHRDHGFNEFTSWGDYYYVEALIFATEE